MSTTPPRMAPLAILCAGGLALAGCGDDAAASHDAAPDDAAPDDASYAAYNLFTGAPRFAIFKADAARDLCVRVVFIWGAGEATLELDDPLTDVTASVTDRAADCDPSAGGGPPSLEAPGVLSESASGTVTVDLTTDGGTDRWTVSIDGVLRFPAGDAWVPETEPLVAETLEIVGGCC